VGTAVPPTVTEATKVARYRRDTVASVISIDGIGRAAVKTSVEPKAGEIDAKGCRGIGRPKGLYHRLCE